MRTTKLYQYIRLLRPQQWYKNLLIFAVPIFAKQIFNLDIYSIYILGFLCLCLISSSNYILNDIIDKKEDQYNPEKKTRPIASGKVTITEALILFFFIFIAATILAYYLNKWFFFLMVLLFVNTQIYSIWLKHEIYLDILIIGINFVIRAFSGYAFLQNIEISHWLIICTFFLSMVLASGKRYSEFCFLKEERKNHRKVLSHYTLENLKILLIISIICFLMSLSIFPFFSLFAKNLIYLLPLAIYLCLRYLCLTTSGSEIGRHPELFYKDLRLLTPMIIYIVGVFCLIYFVR